MKITSLLLSATLASMASVGAASAQVVLNTDLPALNSSNGLGVATTTTNANGTTTIVAGPGANANRVTALPTLGSWYQSDVGGFGTVGITKTYTNDGNGAAFFSTASGDSKGDLRYNFADHVSLRTITGLSFDFFKDAALSDVSFFAPVVRLNILKDGNFAGSLVLEHIYQNQAAVPLSTWTTISADIDSGIFWATNAALGPTFANANGGQKNLQAWIDANASNSLTVTGLSIGVGSGWSGVFSGAIDHVKADFGASSRSALNTFSGNFDFAVAAAVPEPATWAMMIGGFGMIGASMRRRRVSVALTV